MLKRYQAGDFSRGMRELMLGCPPGYLFSCRDAGCRRGLYKSFRLAERPGRNQRREIQRSPSNFFAIRYGHHGPRKANDNMIGGDLHEAHSDLDYFVWVAKRSDRVFPIDTGMNKEALRAPQPRIDPRARPKRDHSCSASTPPSSKT